MADFTPITTQEQFDAMISDRLKRERETLAKKYGDYENLKEKAADYEKQLGEMTRAAQEDAKKYAGFDRTLSDLQAKLRGYETSSVKMRIAHETGIPYELADRLSGETEEEIRADAKSLSGFFGAAKPAPAPLKSTEPPSIGGKNAALRALTEQLTSKGD